MQNKFLFPEKRKSINEEHDHLYEEVEEKVDIRDKKNKIENEAINHGTLISISFINCEICTQIFHSILTAMQIVSSHIKTTLGDPICKNFDKSSSDFDDGDFRI